MSSATRVAAYAAANIDDMEKKQEGLVRKALSLEKRTQLLKWLSFPCDNFPHPRLSDGKKKGISLQAIAIKWCVAEATAQKHLRILVAANLVSAITLPTGKFYHRNEAVIETLQHRFGIMYI